MATNPISLPSLEAPHRLVKVQAPVMPPVCDEEPYPRYSPGEYLVRCVGADTYPDPRFKSYKCRLDFRFMDREGTVSGFFHLGSGEQPKAGRGSEYRRAWVIANGEQPRKRQRLSQRVFQDKVFRVRVDDTRKRYDGREHPEAEVYSTVKEILALEWSSGAPPAPPESAKHRISKSTNQARHERNGHNTGT